MARTGTRRRDKRAGQSLVECAIVLPILILMVVNVVNFGTFIHAWIAVANAARTGAEYATTAGATVGGGTAPTAALVQALVTGDLNGLPNSSSVQVCVSYSNSATVSCNTGTAPTGAPPATDTAESGITFAIGAVDVTYTYQPMIATWPYISLPPTQVHRQAKMRMLQ